MEKKDGNFRISQLYYMDTFVIPWKGTLFLFKAI